MGSGKKRTTTLRYMPSPPRDCAGVGFSSNHPLCMKCSRPARPAILMFSDDHWQDAVAQCHRWEKWLQAMHSQCREKGDQTARVAILEIGAGTNVSTVRN